MSSRRTVVLLSTHNGESYLDAQLQSIFQQTYPNVEVMIRDDGSKDGTSAIIKRWKELYPSRINWVCGQNIGFKKSFLKLVYECKSADYYAFADQDDVWINNKIEIAIKQMESLYRVPCLYMTNVYYTDKDLNITGVSDCRVTGTVWHTLLYNQAIGCTMIFNDALREAIISCPFESLNMDNILAHDGWIFRVCASLGGCSIFDNEPRVYYRQHEKNAIGASETFAKKWLHRGKQFLEGNQRSNYARELHKAYYCKMTDEARKDAKMLVESVSDFQAKKGLLMDPGVYSKNKIKDLALIIAVLSGRI